MPNPLYELVDDEHPQTWRTVPPDAAPVPAGCLLDTLDMRLTDVARGMSRVEMPLTETHLNQRGLPQGGALVAVADAAAGWASYTALPDGRFTTVAISCNLVGRAKPGTTLVALAKPVHLGRQTLVLDVDLMSREQEATDSAPRLVARITCTQLALGS